ncbi:UNVERIFIED_CONTAM: hypothetical protein Scaly_2773000 [Sesamum calycinum]|uniref:Reverse transcriptase domain-containing protein n=1 Tax=Sesamum calycinum TaxID=2727403 RepID=A0AAW2J0I7_9LAMI
MGPSDDFNDMMIDTRLMDAGFEGDPYTWTNKRVWKRLDRVLYSKEWTDTYNSTRVQHLPRRLSDHHPLFITAAKTENRKPSSFRFQNMWLNHHSFFDTVRQEWNLPIEGYGMYKLQQKIYRTKELLKRWNREVFGNVFTTVEHAKQEAEEAEKNFDRDPSEANLIALNKCNAALVHALSLESEYWRQKSNYSVAGPDGFSSVFFKSVGISSKNDIQEAVRDFFCGTPMPRSFKATTIVLIPKVESPQTWSDFRPISLCNVTNKILSKLLYKKLSLSLPNLISPLKVVSSQAGFFKSRGAKTRRPDISSPFIIAAEALSKGIDHLFNGNPDMYFQAKCEVKISHLSYADDVIIFTNCKEAGLLRLMNFLRKFEEQSGQQINQAKSAFIPEGKPILLQTGSRTSLDSL